MNWQKRNCPITMSIKPDLTGWVDVTLNIEGDCRIFSICDDGGCDNFWELPWCLYKLYFYNGCVRRFPNVLSDDGLTILEEGPNALRSVSFKWAEENRYEDWRITAPLDIEATSIVSIDITEDKGVFSKGGRTWTTSKSHYDVSFCDMCYAVGKAITEAMKLYGFTGFLESQGGQILVSALCFLKACGMGKPEFLVARKVISDDQRGHIKTSFADEIELLMFDM